MRKLVPLTAFVTALATSSVTAQILPVGLVAHWRFSGNTLDSSGNNHHGSPNAITYTVGRNGVPNSAATFNGSTSNIQVSNTSDLNLVNYSFCATLKVHGYYVGPCQVNKIFQRGHEGTTGSYSLGFVDNPFDNGNCNAQDTSKNVFYAEAGTNTPPQIDAQYTPTIVSNRWYTVVATYNGAQIRMYVDGVLKSVLSPATTPIGANTLGIIIGRSQFSNPDPYPYQFNGLLDDLRIYNRVLADSEIAAYHNPPTPNNIVALEGNEVLLQLYPNPVGTTLTIDLPNLGNDANKQFEILDITARKTYFIGILNQSKSINVANLPAGVYLLRIINGKGILMQKFIKQ